MVRETGLEPVRAAPHAPQTCASADSATLAYLIFCPHFSGRARDSCGSQNSPFGRGLPHRILTAAPFHTPFIVHRTRSCSMLPIPPLSHIPLRSFECLYNISLKVEDVKHFFKKNRNFFKKFFGVILRNIGQGCCPIFCAYSVSI